MSISFKALSTMPFNFDSPFDLQLESGEVIHLERVLRLIPKRRLVAFGEWRDKPIVAKLFFDPKSAKRHIEKEIKGLAQLKANKIPTPELYLQASAEDSRIQVLLFEYITAKNLAEIWRDKKNIDEIFPQLQAVIIELAMQHVLGVLQQDLHLKNFLLNEKAIYTLDSAQIEFSPQILSKKTSMESLALFLSQLGIGLENYQETLFRHYAHARGWQIKPDDLTELFLLIKKHNETRWQHFQKKIFRDSSDFASFSQFGLRGIYQRHFQGPEWNAFLKNPDAAFKHPNAKILKNGRSSTVIQLTLDQQAFVIKRYNLKTLWHRLRRALRTTRAKSAWRLAQKLNLFGVPTATPIAYLEKRLFCFRGPSYYVTEYIAGIHIGEYFTQNQTHPISPMIKHIAQLLKNLAKLEMTHGDLKASNILIKQNEQAILIDLDGAKEHASLSGLRTAWEKETQRFLRNFQNQPTIFSQFKDELN